MPTLVVQVLVQVLAQVQVQVEQPLLDPHLWLKSPPRPSLQSLQRLALTLPRLEMRLLALTL